MKQKYFLRGMGIGIVITALIFSIIYTLQGPKSMSDDEIIAKARSLGMVMEENNTSQQEKDQDQSSLEEENIKENEESKIETIETDEGTQTVETLTGEDVKPTEDTTEDAIGEEHRNNTVDGKNIVHFIIRSGQNSSSVGQNLESAGLVDSGTKFDAFLEKNGYDKKIKVGDYEIRSGSSYENIAKQITK